MKKESVPATVIATDIPSVAPSEGCDRRGDTAAYLDGELDAGSMRLFEEHVAECETCRGSLAEQRRTLAALNVLFSSRHRVELPREFARKLTARAQTGMDGVRTRGERLHALQVCLALATATIVLLGSAGDGRLLNRAALAWRVLVSIINLVGQTTVDLSASILVLTRALSGGKTMESGSASFLLCGVLLFSLLLLLRLIGTYRSGEQT